MSYGVFAFLITSAGFVGCVVFVTRYVVLSGGSWRDTEAGKFLVVVYTNLAALFLLVMANQIFGDWPLRKVASLLLYTVYVAQTWWPLRLLNLAQRRHREKESK